MSELSKLKQTRKSLTQARKDKIRGISRGDSFGVNFDMQVEHYLVKGINEVWDLVCDVASRRLEEDIKKEAKKMKAEAESVL